MPVHHSQNFNVDVAVTASDETSYAGFMPQKHDWCMITWTPAAAGAGIT